jgi:hypothetical protein
LSGDCRRHVAGEVMSKDTNPQAWRLRIAAVAGDGTMLPQSLHMTGGRSAG